MVSRNTWLGACILSSVLGFGCGDDNTTATGTDAVTHQDVASDADAGGATDAGADAVTDAISGADADAVADVTISADTGGDAAAASFVITIQDFGYSPENLVVPAGGTVTVKNEDTVPHTVTSQAKVADYTPGAVSGVSFDTGNIAAGTTVTFKIAAVATSGTVVPYYCTLHKAGMKNGGAITVQ